MPGDSTFTTSAPWSARIMHANGPDRICETSTIRMPASGPGMGTTSEVRPLYPLRTPITPSFASTAISASV